ncbi:MAG TPA: NUDIX domain-containing protein [Longimicrobiales bacterium]|nr:NUDIX domain-containing protein [Longimicrobiales bacterium]
MRGAREWLAEFVETGIHEYLPHLSVDCSIFGFHGGELKILLVRWKGLERWCLPGGYVGREETVDDAAARVLEERTGLRQIYLRQHRAFGATARGESVLREILANLGVAAPPDLWIFHRVVTVGYLALVDFAEVEPKPDHLSAEVRWWSVLDHPPLLFDHDEILADALAALRNGLDRGTIGRNLLPEKFTMSELQQLYEAVLGRSLDRRNFQRKMLALGVVERLAERRRGVPHRAPHLYRFVPSPSDPADANGSS